jgi:hypothetical protein
MQALAGKFPMIRNLAFKLVATSLFGIAASAGAQTMQPGLWYFWKSAQEQRPAGQPVSGMCLDGKDVQAPAVLVAQFPGDESCRLSALRSRGDGAVEFDVNCGPRGERTAIAVARVAGAQFVTRVTPSGTEASAPTLFIHGSNAGACTK